MSTSPLFPMPEMDVPKIDPEEVDFLHWVFRETFPPSAIEMRSSA